ncbi:cryptochrome/photolyase family protein [Dethiothermospora halolimnae]|uniref:cryptochrome/photolyase family protein n=1 Tax=Dethiothermospora halolimnae TaxID=3114390 RepID=UPI003CCB75CB
MKYNIFWFRRDLRVHDNIGLYSSTLDHNNVLPIFILDENILDNKDICKKRIDFLFFSLKELNENLKSLGSRLIVRKGNPLDVLKNLSNEFDIDSIHFNRDYEPYAVHRDKEIWEYFADKNIKIKSYKDSVLHERREILKKDKTPYSVFTYYYRKWSTLKKYPIYPIPDTLNTPNTYSVDTESLNSGNTLGGESLGHEILEEFLNNKIINYKKYRDIPYRDITSKLSPHLRFGTISIRTIYYKSLDLLNKTKSKDDRDNILAFIRQLAWRDFYFQIIYHHPHIKDSSYIKKYDKVNWENDKDMFNKWTKGETGYPFVDAGMRQLLKEGWMHNRLRMIVASFLTKDLLIDWRWGEKFFDKHLIDYDLALNNGGWQWAASTGTDPQPYFRIFNPITQSEKYDPHGNYIRKYVPELKNVPDEYIHIPYKMPMELQQDIGCVIGKDYPNPIVDHSLQRKKAITMYKNIDN